jgi:hypothetical protein
MNNFNELKQNSKVFKDYYAFVHYNGPWENILTLWQYLKIQLIQINLILLEETLPNPADFFSLCHLLYILNYLVYSMAH